MSETDADMLGWFLIAAGCVTTAIGLIWYILEEPPPSTREASADPEAA